MRESEYGMNGSNSGGSFLTGMLWGAAIGAALGLLLAPKSGAALRGDLMKAGGDLSRKAKKMYDGASETVSDLANQGADVVNQASQAFGQVANRARSAVRTETHS